MTNPTSSFLYFDEGTTPESDTSHPDPFPGDYRLVRRIGSGNFGEVWLAQDLSPLGRPVALKFLRFQKARHERDHQALEVLRNEASILGSIRHPNIVQIHAWRQVGGTGVPCLVLQYVAGGSLESLLERNRPLPWNLATRYVADVAEGLLLLHARGIIHRDVKPANILHDPETDEALLTDFGIASRLADPLSIAGTPRYMAPEAFRGETSPALDVYSLAATLFCLVTGQPPFDGETRHKLLATIEQGLPAIDHRLAGVPQDLETLLRAGLATRPGDRPDLAVFSQGLRGALNLLLADSLAGATSAPAEVRILVSRQLDRDHYVPVASSLRQPESVLRDLKKVPAAPTRMVVRTGDRVRLEVVADQPGHITVFNVGPTGNLNLLYPPEPGAVPRKLSAKEILHILDVELTPPTGQERLFALWTRNPLPLRLEELRSLLEPGDRPTAGAYRATRDMVRVQQSLQQVPTRDRHAVVLELDHQ